MQPTAEMAVAMSIVWWRNRKGDQEVPLSPKGEQSHLEEMGTCVPSCLSLEWECSTAA